jgi:hypothetical protein
MASNTILTSGDDLDFDTINEENIKKTQILDSTKMSTDKDMFLISAKLNPSEAFENFYTYVPGTRPKALLQH